MFRRTMAVLITIALLMMPVAEVAVADSPTAQDLGLVNDQLKGKVADIELADGSTIKKAKKVVVGPNFTYWKAKGNDHKVETGQVVRIRARSKSRGLIGMGVGAGVFGLASLASGTGEANCTNSGTWCTSEDATEAAFVAAAGLGALVGFAVGKAIPRKQKLVYEAQGSPSAEPDEDHADANGLTR